MAVDHNNLTSVAPDDHLDITAFVCPMTFVRTKLKLEKMAPGSVLEVRLRAGEPLENVPRSVTEMGHAVLSLTPESDESETFRLLIQLAPLSDGSS